VPAFRALAEPAVVHRFVIRDEEGALRRPLSFSGVILLGGEKQTMPKRKTLATLALGLLLLPWAWLACAAEVDPYALLQRLVLPEGSAGEVRKEVRTALQGLGYAALPALIEATHYGQQLTWALNLTLGSGESLVLSYQATAERIPLPEKVATSVAAALGQTASSLPLWKEVAEAAEDTVTFRIRVQNPGPEELENLTIVDVLFEGFAYLPGTATFSWPGGTLSREPKIADSAWVRWDAVNVLGNLAYQDPEKYMEAIPALVDRALRDINSHPRWRSLWALSSFGEKIVNDRVLPGLRTGLESPDPRIVWNTAVALAYFRQNEVAPILHQGLNAPDAYTRWEAVYCLGLAHNEESVTLLMEVLVDVEGREVRLRQEAALVLGRIRDPRAIPALVAALRDPASAVRWRAASALAQFQDPSAIPAIEEALTQETDPFAAEQMEAALAILREASGK